MSKALLNIFVDDLGEGPIEKIVPVGTEISLTFWERVSASGKTTAGEYRLRRGASAVKQVGQRWIRSDRSRQILGQKHTYAMRLLGPSDEELVFQQTKLNGDWTHSQLRIRIDQLDDEQLSVLITKPSINVVRQVLEHWQPGDISVFHPSAGPYPLDPVSASERHLSTEEIEQLMALASSSDHTVLDDNAGYKVYSFIKPEAEVELLAYDTATGQRLGLLARDIGYRDVPSLEELEQLSQDAGDTPLRSFLRERAQVVETWSSGSPGGSIPQMLEAQYRFAQRQAIENERFEKALAENDVAGMDADEVLDLVDSADQVVGSLDRRSIYEQDLHNFRIVYGLIVNSEGQLWTPRRSAAKTICPEHLDAGIGGHVKSGETYEAALAREGMEELSMDVIREDVVFLGTLTPDNDGSYAYTKVYRINSETEPIFNPDDISGGEWLWPEEIVALAQTSEKVKSDLLVICEALVSGKLPE